MRKLNVFNFISLDGYYKDINNTISWHQHGGKEENEFSAKNAQSANSLLFGRLTYQMMQSFWTTEQAMQSMPEVAKGMNNAQKYVFSNTLTEVDWERTQIISGDIVAEVIKLKQTDGPHLTILGSGNIISQFAEAGIIDSFQIMIDPVALGSGTAIFNGMQKTLNLELTDTRVFKSGVVLLSYNSI